MESAFLAMAHAGLGNEDSSVEALRETELALKSNVWSARDDLQTLLEEVQDNLKAAGINITQK